jgi:hypothetical protein
MSRYEKIDDLREKVQKKLPDDFREYLQAELYYWSEIDNGWVEADRRNAEDKLIAAMKKLLK